MRDGAGERAGRVERRDANAVEPFLAARAGDGVTGQHVDLPRAQRSRHAAGTWVRASITVATRTPASARSSAAA